MVICRIILILVSVVSVKSAYADLPGLGKCKWEDQSGQLHKKAFEAILNAGTFYVGRDDPVGPINGAGWQDIPIDTSSMKQIVCESKAGISTAQVGTSATGNIKLSGENIPAGSIYPTNVPGLGIVFKSSELKGDISTIEGKPPHFPYMVRVDWMAYYRVRNIPVSFLLVKTGNIAMGENHFEASARVTADGNGRLETFTVSGQVIRSECVLPPASKAIRVNMGNISISDLQALGGNPLYTQHFQIPLTDCAGGSDSANGSWVNITLQGNKGSTIADASNGVLDLNEGSTAKGVAIQIMHGDGSTPLKLGSPVALKKLTNGQMNLDFSARYIKTSRDATAGSANASATFTISYK